MTLPASGPLSMSAINAEFGRGLNLNAYRGTTWFTDAGASGTFTSSNLGFNQFYSKRPTSPTFSFSIGSNQTNANLRTLAVNAGWNQSSAVVATINGGVYLSSNSTGTPGLTINGSFPGGVSLTNNGFIVGMGGNGGAGPTSGPAVQVGPGTAGAGGGLALSVSVGVTITNNGTIAGGGGGGGGGTSSANTGDKGGGNYYGGGGGGGGRSSAAANSSGGAGGAASGAGTVLSGNSGGAGTVSAAGTGGQGGYGRDLPARPYYGKGGDGGGWGSAGATGDGNKFGNPSAGPYGGGSGGGAVSGNGNITWVAFGTRLGGIS